jgi:hypothetical protein
MSMLCPRCDTTHEQRLHCPVCGGRLEYSERVEREGPLAPGWMHTPWGRVLIGLLLSQGLYHGLRQLAGAVLAVVYGGGQPGAIGLPDVALMQALQLTALLLGAVLAGSGQRGAAVLGALLGTWNGVLCVLLQPPASLAPSAVALYGLPLLHASVGGLGGWIGGRIWQPLPVPSLPGASRLLRKPGVARPRTPLFAGPVAWFRVAVGSGLAIAGHLSATYILNTVFEASGGRLSTADRLQDLIITWEIKALAVLAGAALAGVSTRNGLKQGLFVGLLTALVLLALPGNRGTPLIASLVLLATFCLSLAGGWFGSSLLPPVVKFGRTRGLGPAS